MSSRIITAVIFCLLITVSAVQAEIQYNGNNTVIDTETGMIWHTESFGPYTWQEALQACATENWEGFDDWRLPNRNELQSLVDYSTYSPAIDSYLASATFSNYYWTSTTNRANATQAWLVSFQYGNVTYDTKTKGFYIRPVRGGEAVLAAGFNCPTDFIDNDDGTITDSQTGLMWHKDSFTAQSWEEALALCENMDFADKSDWRLPNRNELQSIAFYARHTPAIDTTVFDNTQSGGYWSSTTNRANPTQAWLVNFQYGNVTYDTKTNTYNVRPVRGTSGFPEPGAQCPLKLQDNGDGTVTDFDSGLTWLKISLGPFTWQQALAEAENLVEADKSDWRLPNRHELQSLVFYARHTPAIEPTIFADTHSTGYWTSTNNRANPSQAWLVNFQYGNVTYDSKTGSYYIRPVRGGDVAPSGQCATNLVDNGNGTVTDPTTGLMWLQEAVTAGTWENALFACENGGDAGHSDWRLPSRNELQSLVFYARHTPAIDPVVFPDTPSGSYWTSTTNTANPIQAWVVNFQYGNVTYDTKTVSHYVRPVRGDFGDDKSGSLAMSLPDGSQDLLVGEQVNFVFSSNNQIVRYWWDMNGDGDYDFYTSDGRLGYTFAEPGYKSIRVKGVDSDGNNIVASITLQVFPLDSPEGIIVFESVYPEDNQSEIMRGGKVVRKYRLTNGYDEPVAEKIIYYRWFGEDGLHVSARTDDEGYVDIITPKVYEDGRTFTIVVTNSFGEQTDLQVDYPPQFSVQVRDREFQEEHEMFMGLGLSLGKGLIGFKAGPVEAKTLKVAARGGEATSTTLLYDNREDAADFTIQNVQGGEFGVEAAAGLFLEGFPVGERPLIDAKLGVSVGFSAGAELQVDYFYPDFVQNDEIHSSVEALAAGIVLLESASAANHGKEIAGMDILLENMVKKFLEEQAGFDLNADIKSFTATANMESSAGAGLELANPFSRPDASNQGALEVSASLFEGEYAWSMKTAEFDNGSTSIEQEVAASMSWGKFGVSLKSEFQNVAGKPSIGISDVLGGEVRNDVGELSLAVARNNDGPLSLDFSYLYDREGESFFILGQNTVSEHLQLHTEDYTVLTYLADKDDLARDMLAITPEADCKISFNPENYYKFYETLIGVDYGLIDWEKIVTESEVFKLPLDFEVTLGISLGLDLEFGIGSIISYATEQGSIYNGAFYTTALYEKDELITDNLRERDFFIEEGKRAIREMASSIIHTIEGLVVDGVELIVEAGESVKARVKSFTDTLTGGVKIAVSVIPVGEKSYSVKSLSSKGVEDEAATIGEVYIINMQDENGEPLSIFPAALELTIEYIHDDLIVAGFTVDDAANLRIYRWDGASGYYIYVGGEVDLVGQTVTVDITRSGQHILAIDLIAPELADFGVSNGTGTPEITFQVSDTLSGIDVSSLVFKVDEVELVNGLNYEDYFSVNTGLFTYQPLEPLAGGEHVLELTVADSAGNNETFIQTISVNNVAPVITHTPVATADSGAGVLISAEAVDDEGSALVYLKYRPMVGEADYVIKEMSFSEEDQLFVAVIPAEIITSFGVRYSLQAIDVSGNVTETELIDIVVNDVDGPEIAGGVTADFVDGRFVIEWQEVCDVDLSGYQIFAGDSPFNLVYYEDTGLANRITFSDIYSRYFVSVAAYDAQGNIGSMVGPVPLNLENDHDVDLDVDGADLAASIDAGGIDLERFAIEFGRAW